MASPTGHVAACGLPVHGGCGLGRLDGGPGPRWTAAGQGAGTDHGGAPLLPAAARRGGIAVHGKPCRMHERGQRVETRSERGSPSRERRRDDRRDGGGARRVGGLGFRWLGLQLCVGARAGEGRGLFIAHGGSLGGALRGSRAAAPSASVSGGRLGATSP